MVNVGKYTVRSMDSLWVWSLYIWQMAAFCSCPMEAYTVYLMTHEELILYMVNQLVM